MKVDIKRTGGFAGLNQPLVSVDLATLPKETADRLEQQIGDLASLVARGQGSVGADHLQYEIQLTDSSGRLTRKIVVLDEGAPDAPAMRRLNALLQALT